MRSIVVTAALCALAACNPNPEPAPRGAASITWSISGVGGSHQPCAAVGAASVTLTLRPRSGGDVITSFPCADGHGTTSLVIAAAYEATLSLRSANGSPIAIGPTQRSVIVAPNETVALAPVTFDVPNATALELSISALGAPLGNCKAGMGGAAITDTFVGLERVDTGKCMPTILFVTKPDGTPKQIYILSCLRPAPTTCVERGETMSSATLPPGKYRLRVTGLREGVACWSDSTSFLITANTHTRRTVELKPTGAPGCEMRPGIQGDSTPSATPRPDAPPRATIVSPRR